MVSCRPVSSARRSLVPTPSVPETNTRSTIAMQRHLHHGAKATQPGQYFGPLGAADQGLDALHQGIARIDIHPGVAVGYLLGTIRSFFVRSHGFPVRLALSVAHAAATRDISSRRRQLSRPPGANVLANL